MNKSQRNQLLKKVQSNNSLKFRELINSLKNQTYFKKDKEAKQAILSHPPQPQNNSLLESQSKQSHHNTQYHNFLIKQAKNVKSREDLFAQDDKFAKKENPEAYCLNQAQIFDKRGETNIIREQTDDDISEEGHLLEKQKQQSMLSREFPLQNPILVVRPGEIVKQQIRGTTIFRYLHKQINFNEKKQINQRLNQQKKVQRQIIIYKIQQNNKRVLKNRSVELRNNNSPCFSIQQSIIYKNESNVAIQSPSNSPIHDLTHFQFQKFPKIDNELIMKMNVKQTQFSNPYYSKQIHRNGDRSDRKPVIEHLRKQTPLPIPQVFQVKKQA